MRKNNYQTTIHKGYVTSSNWFIEKIILKILICFIYSTLAKYIWNYLFHLNIILILYLFNSWT
jgi:hypothetical protein